MGVEQTLRLHYFLLFAGHAAGLCITTHRCATAHARAVHPSVGVLFDRFPVVRTRARGLWSCIGVPAHIFDFLGLSVAGCHWPDGLRIVEKAC
eukprot:11209817-Lingulodinium_polyedra.AAC.1